MTATCTNGSLVGSASGFNCIQVDTGDRANLGLITRFPFICVTRALGYNQDHLQTAERAAFFLPRSKESGFFFF